MSAESAAAAAGALEFGGAPAVALAAMLQIGKTLESEEFAKKVVPALSKLFASTDRAIRRSLLESIDVYGQHLDEVSEARSKPPVQKGASPDLSDVTHGSPNFCVRDPLSASAYARPRNNEREGEL